MNTINSMCTSKKRKEKRKKWATQKVGVSNVKGSVGHELISTCRSFYFSSINQPKWISDGISPETWWQIYNTNTNLNGLCLLITRITLDKTARTAHGLFHRKSSEPGQLFYFFFHFYETVIYCFNLTRLIFQSQIYFLHLLCDKKMSFVTNESAFMDILCAFIDLLITLRGVFDGYSGFQSNHFLLSLLIRQLYIVLIRFACHRAFYNTPRNWYNCSYSKLVLFGSNKNYRIQSNNDCTLLDTQKLV